MELLIYLCGAVVCYWVCTFIISLKQWNVPKPLIIIIALITAWKGLFVVLAVIIALLLYTALEAVYNAYTTTDSDEYADEYD